MQSTVVILTFSLVELVLLLIVEKIRNIRRWLFTLFKTFNGCNCLVVAALYN